MFQGQLYVKLEKLPLTNSTVPLLATVAQGNASALSSTGNNKSTGGRLSSIVKSYAEENSSDSDDDEEIRGKRGKASKPKRINSKCSRLFLSLND